MFQQKVRLEKTCWDVMLAVFVVVLFLSWSTKKKLVLSEFGATKVKFSTFGEENDVRKNRLRICLD